jgi:hypothetical protein
MLFWKNVGAAVFSRRRFKIFLVNEFYIVFVRSRLSWVLVVWKIPGILWGLREIQMALPLIVRNMNENDYVYNHYYGFK